MRNEHKKFFEARPFVVLFGANGENSIDLQLIFSFVKKWMNANCGILHWYFFNANFNSLIFWIFVSILSNLNSKRRKWIKCNLWPCSIQLKRWSTLRRMKFDNKDVDNCTYTSGICLWTWTRYVSFISSSTSQYSNNYNFSFQVKL